MPDSILGDPRTASAIAEQRDRLRDAARDARRAKRRDDALAHIEAALALDPDHPETRLEHAGDLVEFGRLDDAERAYRAALATPRASIQAHLGLGRCARKRGDRAAALAHHRNLIAAAPANGWGYVEAAADLTELGRLDEAEAAARTAIGLPGTAFNAHLALGRCARKRDDRHTALVRHSDCIATAPGNVWGHIEAAADLIALDRIPQAETAYRAALAIDPNQFQARAGLGRCARKRGDRACALAIHRDAAERDPSNPSAHMQVAEDLLALDRAQEAETAYTAALALDPNQVDARLGLARCARSRGDTQTSLAANRQAACLAPANMWTHLAVAADLRQLGRLDEAEAAARAAASRAPAQPEPHLALAGIARARGNRAAALAHAQAAYDAAPRKPWGLLEMAGEYRALARFTDAADAYARLRAFDPANIHALIGLGQLARAVGDRAGALSWFERAVAADPGSARPLLDLATEHREMGRSQDAHAALDRALAIEPANLHAHLGRGSIERQDARHQTAHDAYEQAHLLHPALAQPLLDMAAEQRSLGNPAACARLLARARDAEPASPALSARLAEHAMMEGDPETALAFHAEAAAARPLDPGPAFGAIEALVTLGRVPEALARLDAIETAHPASAIQAELKRISILRRTGENRIGLDCARALANREPRDIHAATERLLVEMLVGSEADIDAALAAFPAATPREHARHARLAARVHEERGELDQALAGYARAEALDPRSGEIQQDLARLAIWPFDLRRMRAHLVRFSKAIEPVARLRGRSSNVAQSHYGQILDEFELDRATIDRLRPLLAIPPADRVPPILAIVADNPDSTAAAIALLAAMRELPGLIGAPPDPPDGEQAREPGRASPIPRRIAQYWDEAAPPADIADLTATWRRHNAGWDYELFDDAKARAFLLEHHGLPTLVAYRMLPEPAQKADLFRLAWLATCGGLYVDADDRCLAPIDGLIPRDATFVAYQEDLGTLANNIVAAIPNHPVIRRALEGAVASALRGDRDIVWLSTGPALLSRAFAHALATATPTAPWRDRLATTTILKRRDLFRYAAVHCHTGYKRTEKHWSNTAYAGRRLRNDPGSPSRQSDLPVAAAAAGAVVDVEKISSSPTGTCAT